MLKPAIYRRVSSDNQKKPSPQNSYCERKIENGIIWLICHRCGWVGRGSAISKDFFYPQGKLKRYPEAKCPNC